VSEGRRGVDGVGTKEKPNMPNLKEQEIINQH